MVAESLCLIKYSAGVVNLAYKQLLSSQAMHYVKQAWPNSLPCSLQVRKFNLLIEYPVSLQRVTTAEILYEKKDADR